MKIKRFVLFSILYLVIVGVYIFINIEADYTLRIADLPFTYPVALWVMLPAVLMFLFALLHLSFYGTLGYFKQRRMNKDLDATTKIIKNALLGKPLVGVMHDKRLKEMERLFKGVHFNAETTYRSEDEEINSIIDAFKKIEAGDVVDTKQLKLDPNSAMAIKNEMNRLKQDPESAESILKDAINETLRSDAFSLYLTFADKKKIEKIGRTYTKENTYTLLGRYRAQMHGLDFSYDEIKKLAMDASFDAHDYIRLAKKWLNVMEPDAILELFYHLQNEIPQAASGYIYVNLEFEKLEEVTEYLEQFSDDEMKDFRYYLVLKHAGVKVDLKDYIK